MGDPNSKICTCKSMYCLFFVYVILIIAKTKGIEQFHVEKCKFMIL